MSSITDELRALSGSTENAFTVLHGGRSLHVAIQTDNDDDVTGLVIWFPYDHAARAQGEVYRDGPPLVGPRPMSIELRPETAGDMVAKNRGVTVEWQSGDPAFDDEVFVDSPVGDASLLHLVIGPEARAGTLELFALGFDSVQIDSEGRGAVIASLPRKRFDASAPRALAAFERILSRLPAVTASGEVRRANPVAGAVNLVLIAFGAAGWAVNVGYAGGLAMLVHLIRGHEVEFTPQMVLGPIAFGLAMGIVFGWGYKSFVERSFRGTSNAHKRGRMAALVGFAGMSVIAFSITFVLGGVIYGEAPR